MSIFNISHKDVKNCIYYNIFAEEFLKRIFKKKLIFEKKYFQPIFISSNTKKIKYVQSLLKEEFSELSFYGLFGNKVDNTLDDYHLNAQHLVGQHKSAICIENSEEIGYIQGNFLIALLSGTVPIIKASKYILKNILIPECYVELNDYSLMSSSQKLREIDKRSNYILSDKEIFTNLAKDYLEYIKEMNLKNISSCIVETQKFKKRIFEL